MDLDAILRRVQKLLAIAQDGRADPNEAAAAAGQAENIMRKFNLEHADVLRARLRDAPDADMDTVRCRANMKRDDPKRTPLKRPPTWAGSLGFEVAMLHDVHVRFVRAAELGGVVVEFCGLRADVAIAGWTFDYLVGELIRGCEQFGVQHRDEFGCPPPKTANASYRTGFSVALTDALRKLRRNKKEAIEQHSAGTALVVAKQAAIAAHFGTFSYGRGAQRHVSDRGAYGSGLADGARVDVTRRADGATTGAAGRLTH